jgi:hypothetical protein
VHASGGGEIWIKFVNFIHIIVSWGYQIIVVIIVIFQHSILIIG